MLLCAWDPPQGTTDTLSMQALLVEAHGTARIREMFQGHTAYNQQNICQVTISPKILSY